MPSTSHSEVETYLRCRRKHYYGYGLGLDSVTLTGLQAIDSAVHKVLGDFYATIVDVGGEDPKAQLMAFDGAVTKARATYDSLLYAFDQDYELGSLEEILFDWYFPHEPFVRTGWQVLSVNSEFELEYDGERGLTFPFVVDLILSDPQNRIVAIEHAAVWNFYNHADVQFLQQIPKYVGALRALNVKINYGMYNMVRARKIAGLKMNKPDLVEAIYEAVSEDQEAMEFWSTDLSKVNMPDLESLATTLGIDTTGPPTVGQLMRTLQIEANVSRVQRTFMEQIDTASEIAELRTLPIEDWNRKAFRAGNTSVCTDCAFRELCTKELVGGDVRLLIATEFTVRSQIS